MDSTLFLGSFALYLALLIALSWFVGRKQQDGDDFLLAGRKVSCGLSLGTTIATMIGTGTSMGAVGYAYLNGWAGMLYGLGGAVGILLTAWLFAPMRQLRFVTMSEELAFYVGANRWVKNGCALLIFLASLGWLGAHIIGGALYLSWATGMDMFYAKLLIAFAFTVYVVVGGYAAVVWTDAVMAFLLFGGFILMTFAAVHYVGGFAVLLDSVPGELQGIFSINKIGLLPALSLAAVIAVGVLATPSYRQRIYSAESVQAVRKSFTIAGILYLLFAAFPALIGLSARLIAPELANHQFAFTTVIVSVLPLALGLLVLIAGLSATLSSASSDAIAAVSVFMRDLHLALTGRMAEGRQALLLSRICLVLVSALALSLSLISDDIIHYITSMIALLMSGLLVCALLGRFWRRFTWQGAIAALMGAAISSLAVLLQGDWLAYWGNPCLPALAGALSAAVLVSLLTPPNRVSSAQALAIINQQRELTPPAAAGSASGI